MTLSILICTIQGREGYLSSLVQELVQQKAKLPIQLMDQVEILIESDNGAISTGRKRNSLVLKSTGKYIVFVDDDDMVAPTYIADIMEASKQDPDVIVFNGIMTTNGRDERKWYISKEYGYEAKDGAYYRYPNHIVPVRRSIAIQFPFPDIKIGEDYLYATAMHNSKFLKTEVKINKELYHYQFRTNK
jgi:glycosyltransferase involved in cell wall biosynthesis